MVSPLFVAVCVFTGVGQFGLLGALGLKLLSLSERMAQDLQTPH